ncbi:UvrD-helicase domain-containing protein [Shigella flexneri]
MDVSYLLDSLNDKQREAVAAPRSNLLVLAGAGSGRRASLVRRVARLMSAENCSPYSIMAVTFTDKVGGGDASSSRATDRHQPGRHVGWHLPRAGAPPAASHHMDADLPQDFADSR